jgi:uncharacterized protein
MNLFKKYVLRFLGVLSVGVGYIGVFIPGLPTTTFVVLAAWLFAKSSPEFNKWLHEHPILGRYLNDWEQRRVYPTHGKMAMTGFMIMSLIIMWFTTSVKAVIFAFIFFTTIVIWAWKYPGSVKEYERRIKKGEKIGWLK